MHLGPASLSKQQRQNSSRGGAPTAAAALPYMQKHKDLRIWAPCNIEFDIATLAPGPQAAFCSLLRQQPFFAHKVKYPFLRRDFLAEDRLVENHAVSRHRSKPTFSFLISMTRSSRTASSTRCKMHTLFFPRILAAWLMSPGGLHIVFSVLNIIQRPQHCFLAKLWHKNDVFDEKKGVWGS